MNTHPIMCECTFTFQCSEKIKIFIEIIFLFGWPIWVVYPSLDKQLWTQALAKFQILFAENIYHFAEVCK